MNKISKIICYIVFISLRVIGGNTWDDGGITYNWSESTNWNPSGVPTNGQNVYFGSKGTYVDVDKNVTVGSITFNRKANFTINGPMTVTESSIYTTRAKTYTINANMNFGDNNTWDVITGSTLNINGDVNGLNKDLNITSDGITNVSGNVTNVNNLTSNGSGTLNINHKTISVDGSISLNSGILKIGVDNTSYGQLSGDNINLGNGTTLVSIDDNGYTPVVNDRIWLMLNNGNSATTGYFAGYTQGSSITLGGQVFHWFYGADFATGNLYGGNDVLLAVPEPSTMLLFMFGSLFLFRKIK